MPNISHLHHSVPQKPLWCMFLELINQYRTLMVKTLRQLFGQVHIFLLIFSIPSFLSEITAFINPEHTLKDIYSWKTTGHVLRKANWAACGSCCLHCDRLILILTYWHLELYGEPEGPWWGCTCHGGYLLLWYFCVTLPNFCVTLQKVLRYLTISNS